MRLWLCFALALMALPVLGAERAFDFGEFRENASPTGFVSLVMGGGGAGEWKVVLDDVPPLLEPLTPQAPVVTKRAVLAQLSEDRTDERFPILLWEGGIYRDFRFTARFKTVRGAAEQMAGLVFRALDETNYYVLRASSLGNNVRFYKVVNGQRGPLYGPQTNVAAGVWHELAVECEGNEIRCFFNGTQIIPDLSDSSFSIGKIGFWTKSDSVSYFADARLAFTPLEAPGQALVRRTLEKYTKLEGLRIFVPGKEPGTMRVLASKDASEIGQAGGENELNVVKNGSIYYGKSQGTAVVTMPLRDRNGEAIAAVRVVLKRFPGQTEQNAVERAAPIVREMQARIASMDDLVEPALPRSK